MVRAHARLCGHGLGRRDVPVPLGDGDRRKADGVAVICISYRTLRTLLGLVIVLLALLIGLAIVSWAGEPPRDCCRDLGAVQIGVIDALNSGDLQTAKKYLVGAMEGAGVRCEQTPGGWQCR